MSIQTSEKEQRWERGSGLINQDAYGEPGWNRRQESLRIFYLFFFKPYEQAMVWGNYV